MALETTTAGVFLTEAAANRLKQIMAEKNILETHALRVFVQGGGCGGMQYGMTFDDCCTDNDEVYEHYGLKVYVDPVSLFYLNGSRIDYIDDLMGGGFHIENPNAVSSCGCGSSFKTETTHDGRPMAGSSCSH
jgi:iron-sulfur cluster assembly protein